MSALGRRHAGDNSTEQRTDTRELLLQCARKLFAEKGFEGATVKDVAEAAGVNVSLVSYYFGGKDGLYRDCISDFGRDRLASMERFLTRPESAEDIRVRMTLLIEEVLETHAAEPHCAKILHREFDSNAEHIQDLFQTVFIKMYSTMVEFFTHAQTAGLLHGDFDPRIAVGMFFGGLIQTIRMDGIAREQFGRTIADPQYRAEVARNTATVFLQGMLSAPARNPEIQKAAQESRTRKEKHS